MTAPAESSTPHENCAPVCAVCVYLKWDELIEPEEVKDAITMVEGTATCEQHIYAVASAPWMQRVVADFGARPGDIR